MKFFFEIFRQKKERESHEHRHPHRVRVTHHVVPARLLVVPVNVSVGPSYRSHRGHVQRTRSDAARQTQICGTHTCSDVSGPL